MVTYGGIKRGNREIYVEAKDGAKKKYMVQLSKHILVQDGDFVRAGDAALRWRHHALRHPEH